MHNYCLSRSRGFTLLEVLIAITITALIGLGSWQLLNGAIKSYELGQKSLEGLSLLQRTQLTISRDFRQLIPRPIRDEYGDYQPALSSGQDLAVVELTRVGWRNPLQQPRSQVQRVAYELVDKDLMRLHWTVLDRAQDSVALSRRLLSDVDRFEVSYLNDSKAWVDEWPPGPASNSEDPPVDPIAAKAILPKAVRVTLEHPRYGNVQRVFDLPSYVEGVVMQASNDGGANDGGNGGDVSGDTGNEQPVGAVP